MNVEGRGGSWMGMGEKGWVVGGDVSWWGKIEIFLQWVFCQVFSDYWYLLGLSKVEAARDTLSNINPDVEIHAHNYNITR